MKIFEVATNGMFVDSAIVIEGEGNPNWGRDLWVSDPERRTFAGMNQIRQELNKFDQDDQFQDMEEAIGEFADWIGLEERDLDWHKVKQFMNAAREAQTFFVAGSMADEDDDDDDSLSESILIAI